MAKVSKAEKQVKVEMINEIIKHFNNIYLRSELESKTFSELKYMYYNCRKPSLESCNDSIVHN